MWHLCVNVTFLCTGMILWVSIGDLFSKLKLRIEPPCDSSGITSYHFREIEHHDFRTLALLTRRINSPFINPRFQHLQSVIASSSRLSLDRRFQYLQYVTCTCKHGYHWTIREPVKGVIPKRIIEIIGGHVKLFTVYNSWNVSNCFWHRIHFAGNSIWLSVPSNWIVYPLKILNRSNSKYLNRPFW